MRNFLFILVYVVCLYPAGVQAQSVTEKLDGLFLKLVNDSMINGSVLVADNGKPIYEKNFGYANTATQSLINSQTMFELASVSKQFTAMAIMQLKEKGLLQYSDNIQTYFPKLSFKNVTIRNLLQHTSGIPEFLAWGPDKINTKKINTNKDILSVLEGVKERMFAPGNQLVYSNTNYVLLALIVEKVSGLPFNEYLDKNIFIPLGMKNTRIYNQRDGKNKEKNFALGYVYDASKGTFVVSDSLVANSYQYYFDGVNGPYGISSSAEDMLKWDNALYTEKLISKINQDSAYIPAKLTNDSLGLIGGVPYGFGWLLPPDKPERGRLYLHTGGYPGYQTIIARYPEKHKTIIILTNRWNVINIYDLTRAIQNILFDKPFEVPVKEPYKKSVPLSAAAIKAIEGTYYLKIAPNFKISITSEFDHIYAQLTNQPKAEIYAASDVDFFYTVVDAKLKFFKDDSGNVWKMTLYQGGKELEVIKEKKR